MTSFCGKVLDFPREFVERAAGIAHDFKHAQRGEQAVAGGGMLQKNNVAGLLAAEHAAAPQHLLKHILVADRRARHFNAVYGERLFESEVGHDGRDYKIARQFPGAFQAGAREKADRVAIDHLAALGDEERAVGVAIERDAQMRACFGHALLQALEMERTSNPD